MRIHSRCKSEGGMKLYDLSIFDMSGNEFEIVELNDSLDYVLGETALAGFKGLLFTHLNTFTVQIRSIRNLVSG